MNIEITEKENKLMVSVVLVPYKEKRREPKIIRQSCSIDDIKKVLKDKGFTNYALDENVNQPLKIDNKHGPNSGLFTLVKEKPPIKEKPLVNKELDTEQKSVIQSTKSKRRKSNNTVE
jgi:hypothetical protein